MPHVFARSVAFNNLTLISLDTSPDPFSIAFAPQVPMCIGVFARPRSAESFGLGRECLVDKCVESGDRSVPDQVVLHSGFVEKVVVVVVNVIPVQIVE